MTHIANAHVRTPGTVAVPDAHPMIAASDRLRALSDASGLSGEWHNTVVALRDAADFLMEAAEMIARGGAGDALARFPTPERAVDCARACIDRVHERGAVWAVLSLPL